MSQYKIDKYMQEITNEIYQQSNEYKMLELGIAYGYFNALHCFKPLIDKTEHDEIIKSLCQGAGSIWEHFRKLVEADKYENSKTEDLIEKFEEFGKE